MRILLCTFGSFGDVNPYLGLALELRARGHEAVLATSEFYRGYIESNGVEFAPVRPDVDPSDRSLLGDLMHGWRGPREVLRLVTEPLAATYEDTLTAAREAELVVSHPITFCAPIAAEVLGLRWVSTVLSPMSLFSLSDFPVVAALPVGEWLWRPEGVVARAVLAFARRETWRWTEPVRRLRKRVGLSAETHPFFEGQYSRWLTLGLFSSVLATPRADWPSPFRITGPIFFDRGADIGGEAESLREFLEAGPAPIVFTLGSAAVGAAGEFFAESLAAARAVKERAILVTGPQPENRLGADGSDVLEIGGAPFSELFPRAKLVVHQGGVGTLQQCFRAGRPALVVPFAHDQPDNARRAVELGVALALPITAYRARSAARKLGRLRDDARFTRSAARIAAAVGAERGARSAAAAIEELGA